MSLPARKEIYTEVERIREEIDEAFYAWRSQDASVGQERPTLQDLINEIARIIHPITVLESKVTHVAKLVWRDGNRLQAEGAK